MRPALKKMMVCFAIVTSLFLIVFLYPLIQLTMTDADVTKSLFAEQYYVKISSKETDIEVFRKYMENKGWIENESKRLGGLYIFEKDGKEKHILNTNIKIVFIDGKLNF